MNLKKVASLLKEASAEIRKLKAENESLREKLNDLGKEAAFKEEEGLLGFGEVAEDDFSISADNSKDLMKMYFGG